MQDTYLITNDQSVSYTSISNRPAKDELVLFEVIDILTNDLGYTKKQATDLINSFQNAGLTIQWSQWRKENYPNGKV